jgi:hypothetical protein
VSHLTGHVNRIRWRWEYGLRWRGRGGWKGVSANTRGDGFDDRVVGKGSKRIGCDREGRWRRGAAAAAGL